MYKTINKFIIRFFLFALVTKGILFIIDTRMPFYYGDSGLKFTNEFHSKYNYLKQHENVQRTYFIGSSLSHRQIDCQLFNKLSCIENSTFNFSSPATFIPENMLIAKKFIEDSKTKPDILFLELMLIEESLFEKFIFNSPKSRYVIDFENFKKMNTLLLGNEYKKGNLKNYVFNFWGINMMKLKFLYFFDLITIRDETLGKNLDGFYPLDIEIKETENPTLQLRAKMFEGIGKRKFNNRLQEINTEGIFNDAQYIDADKMYEIYIDFLEYAKSNDVTVIYIVPQFEIYKDAVKYVYEQLPSNNKIAISNIKEYPFLAEKSNYFDHGHLNSKGAKIFTRALAKKYNALANCN